jgi:ABC-2 type transport system permease protein
MTRFFAIYQRELSYFFNSLTAYVVIAIFVLLGGYFFYNLVGFFSLASARVMQNPMAASQLSITTGIMQPLFGNLSVVMLLIMPLLTMRLLSEERKTGTAELLFTYPISDWDAIMGKYLATVSVFAVMLALTGLFPALLQRYASLEWGPIVTGYLGLFLLGMAFVAMGLFFSSLSDNQLVAAILTFGCGLLFLIIGWMTSFVSPTVGAIIAEVSIIQHFDSFSKGVIVTNDIVYYLNFTIFFLFLSSRVLESNRWRS